MSDIIAHLEVLSQESGCILDLSAILDQSICPKVDLKTHKGHTVEENDDYICVTPTEVCFSGWITWKHQTLTGPGFPPQEGEALW